STFLETILKDQHLIFKFENKTITVSHQAPATLVPAVDQSGTSSNTPPADSTRFKGEVVTDQGKPLEHASILIKATRRHVYADRNGIFVITGVNVGMTLVISYPGFVEAEHEIKTLARSSTMEKLGVDVYTVLQPSKSEMDETQVIAYGRVSKRLNAGN